MKKDYDKIEEELSKKDQERKKKRMRISGKSVFGLKRIIDKKRK